ncbi:MAG: tRNA (adenosine(37)-N6)-dimethylallyltransferase MiaA [Anaerolineae bacterium]
MPSNGDPGMRRLVVLLGPTAVGKTALSLELAETLNGEIISADSRLIYRGMDIGVAKPTPEEQARVPHHLLDIVTPDQTLSLAEYQKAACAAIESVQAQGKLPLLVGGTGQYITAVVEGWDIPEVAPNPELRATLEDYAQEHGPQALWQRLAEQDPAAAEQIHPHNIRRVIRAIEVFQATGRSITDRRKTPLPYPVLQVGLARPRADLYARIDARIDQMLATGLVDEVKGLLARGYDRRLAAMSGLGYRQIVSWLEGEVTFEEAIAELRRATRDFARRQEVWFRKYNRQAHWFDMTETSHQTIIDFVRNWLESRPYA